MVLPYDSSQETFDIIAEEENTIRAREERRRTGRYLALGIAIFLLLLGFYHAVAYKLTKYAALLGTALIMFLYLLWLLYASNRKKKEPEDLNNASELGMITAEPSSVTETKTSTKTSKIDRTSKEKLVVKPDANRSKFKRTYSIA